MRHAVCHPERRHHAKDLCSACYYASMYTNATLAPGIWIRENTTTGRSVVLVHSRIPEVGVIVRKWKQCRRVFPSTTLLPELIAWQRSPVMPPRAPQRTICSHKGRKAHAHGLCRVCYERQRGRSDRTPEFYRQEYARTKDKRRQWKIANRETSNTSAWLRNHIPELELRKKLREDSQWLAAAKQLALTGRVSTRRGMAAYRQRHAR